MKKETLINAITDIIDNVPQQYQTEAITSVVEQYDMEMNRWARYQSLKEFVMAAIRPALADYARDTERTLYDGINDCIVYLRLEREESYKNAIHERDRLLNVAEDECITSAEEKQTTLFTEE